MAVIEGGRLERRPRFSAAVSELSRCDVMLALERIRRHVACAFRETVGVASRRDGLSRRKVNSLDKRSSFGRLGAKAKWGCEKSRQLS